MMQGREFNVSRDSIFTVPVEIEQTDSGIDAVNETIDIFYQQTVLNVLANDTLGFTPTIISQVTTDMPDSVGTLSVGDGVIIFEAGSGIVTPQTFDYTIVDSTGQSDTATVTLNISAVPVTVQAIDDFYNVDNADPVILDVMSNDVLGTEPTDIISFDDTGLTSGSITNNGTDLTFTPNGTIPVSDETFTYTIEDDTATTSQATVTLTVTSASDDNRYLTKVVNIGVLGGTVSGQYTNGAFFFFDVPEGETVDINACVIFSSILESPNVCLLYTSPSPRDRQKSRMPSSA